jgi:chromosome segregation ATPase
MNEYERLAIIVGLDSERLGHENHAFHQEMVRVLDKDLELSSGYHRLSEVQWELSHTRTKLQEAWEEIYTRTHAIVHLEHAIKQQDSEHEVREEEITNLFQQVLDL